MFLDEINNQLALWPIAGLVEGETSEIITIKIPCPSDAILKSGPSDKITVWAKWAAFPANPYFDITNGPGISLTGIPGPYGEFLIYVEALGPIDVFERVTVTVSASEAGPAAWTT